MARKTLKSLQEKIDAVEKERSRLSDFRQGIREALGVKDWSASNESLIEKAQQLREYLMKNEGGIPRELAIADHHTRDLMEVIRILSKDPRLEQERPSEEMRGGHVLSPYERGR